MTDPNLIADLVRAGVDADLIGRVANALLEAGVRGIPVEFPVDKSAEKRRAYDRERKRVHRNSGGIPPDSAEIPIHALSIEESKKDKRQRGTRISADWRPSDSDREFALAQGLPIAELDRESEKFRDYWNAKAGAQGVKLDWSATWRNWIRRVCEQRGFAPVAAAVASTGPPRPPSPDMPSHEELMKRYAPERGKTEPTTDEGTSLLAEGLRVREAKSNGLVSGSEGFSPAQSLGRILS